METGPYLYLCRARFLRQVQFYLAVCFFVVNLQNVGDTFLVLDARLSPEIYSLSQYINEYGLEAQSVVCLIWAAQGAPCARTQETAEADARLLADFPNPGEGKSGEVGAKLNSIFPEGKSLVLTFAASKETFPKTPQNFLAALASHPELKCRLIKEFWYAGEKIYEVYEIDRSPRRIAIRHVAPLKFTDRTQQENRDWPFAINSEKADFEILDESRITADFQVSWQRL